MSNSAMYLQEIAQIEKETFSDAWSLQSIKETMQQSYNIAFVLLGDEEGDSKIAIYKADEKQLEFTQKSCGLFGYLLANQIAGESELLRIAVKKEYQGKKYGEALLCNYLKYISDTCEKAFLEVRESNIKARTLYEKHGYIVLAKRKNYYNHPLEDGIIYEYIPDNAK